jgi:GNAT superfamily N-acetyltransferase
LDKIRPTLEDTEVDATANHADVDFVAVPTPLIDLLDDTARRFAGRPAIDFLGRGQTWGTVADLADRAAAGLQALGVGKGVCVGLCLPNTPYSVILYFAILKVGGTVVGFGSLSEYRDRPAYATTVENSVYVDAERRGCGIGRALLEELIELATDHGFHTVVARIGGDNEPSIALHQACGFEIVGTEREIGRKFGRWLDVWVLQRML